MTNKIEAIKAAIMTAFPGAKGVSIYLDEIVMDIKVLPGTEDEVEEITVEGLTKWKATE